MKKNIGYFLLLIATAGITMRAHAQLKLNRINITEVVVAMTLDEKAHLVVGMGMHFGPPPVAGKDSAKTGSNTQQEPVIGTTQDKVPENSGVYFDSSLTCVVTLIN